MEVDYISINKAFSKQAPNFDDEDLSNPILQWMRGEVRRNIEGIIKPGDKILELNAGTGLDAVYLAQKGYRVHATDLSDGMITAIKTKISHYNLPSCLSTQQLSYTELNRVDGAPYDFIFSNFGGLNCVPELKEVSKNVMQILKPGGVITMVIMPPVCPWEIGAVLKGNFRQAFRRFKTNGSLAHLEGEHFMTYYFSLNKVLDDFGEAFKLTEVRSLGIFCPPPHRREFALRHKSFVKRLMKIDEKLAGTFPFNGMGDHLIISLTYR